MFTSPVAAGAATTTTTQAPPASSSTVPPNASTTVPKPPPAFTLPSDFGYKLVSEMERAKSDQLNAQTSMLAARADLKKAEAEDAKVKKQLQKLNKEARDTAIKLNRTRDRLRQAAAQAYMHAGNGEILSAISTFLNTNSAVDAASTMHVLRTFSVDEQQALEEYLKLKARVDKQVRRISELADRTARGVRAAKDHVTSLAFTIAEAKTRIATSVLGIAKFHEAATSALSPILGPSRLTAKQMAGFVMANGGRPRITVTLEELAQLYLDEGERTGVRGDVAFAQSILETGSFRNPGSSATDNNFAGIGWCDSCAHGYNFPDARAGVRAQLQLLRIYVDPTFPDPKVYTDEILLKGTLKLGFRGRVQTWWDLWGTWATGALYGQRVYDIYERMVDYATDHPDTSKPPATTPGKTPTGEDITRPPGSGPGTKGP
jgi:hypothetical protein